MAFVRHASIGRLRDEEETGEHNAGRAIMAYLFDTKCTRNHHNQFRPIGINHHDANRA